MTEWRYHHETVEHMLLAGWKVRSLCMTCTLPIQVDLLHTARSAGKEASLWGKQPKCRDIRCNGRVKFYGRPPGCREYREMGPQPGVAREKFKHPGDR